MEQSRLGERRLPAVFITGAGGEVGHGLISSFHKEGRKDIVATDICELDGEQREKCSATYLADVCDRDALDRILSMYQVKEMYHLAAVLSTRAEFAPEIAHQVNVNGTVNMLQIAAEQGRMYGEPVKVVFPSSIAVYGFGSLEDKSRAGSVSEYEHCKPSTMYGCNKLYCEHLGRYYAHSYRQLASDSIAGEDKNRGVVDFRCVRYPGLISAETIPTGGTSDFVPEMLHAAARGEQYNCFVREDSRIPFMTMKEAIDATLQLASVSRESLSQIVYNISSFSPTAGEVAALVRGYFPDADISFQPDARRQAIVDSWPEALDCSVAANDWGFKPKYTLETAFEEYLVPRVKKQYESTS